MTISIPTKTPSAPLTVHHHTLDGIEGYLLRTPGTPIFLTEKDADALARYMLFKTPPEVTLPPSLGLGDPADIGPNDIGAHTLTG